MPRTLLKLLVLLASSAASLALLELGFRVYESHFLIHELAPDAPFYDLVGHRYNDHEGFLAREKAGDELRILSFGDSFAESATLAEHAYASVLQRQLSNAAAPRRVRVVNFGKSGTSFPGYAAQYRAWSRQVEFDAVLLNLYSGNDFFDMRGVVYVEAEGRQLRALSGGGAPLRYGPGLDIPRKFPLRVLDYAYAAFYSWRYADLARARPVEDAAGYREDSLQYPHDVYLAAQSRQVSVLLPDGMESYFDAYFWLYKLLVIAREIEAEGVPVAITVAPPHFVVDRGWREEVLANVDTSEDRIDLDLPAVVVEALAREAGFEGPVIDLADCLRRLTEEGAEPYWGTNTHWSVLGNRIVGELLAAELGPRWLSVDAPSASQQRLGCSTQVPPGSARVTEGIAEAVPVITDLLRFEETTGAALLGRHFEDRAAVASALEAAGWRQGSEFIAGAFEGFRSKPGDRISRPHGLRKFIRPTGWAVDRARPGESLFVVLLHGGRVAGIARTREVADAELASRAEVPPGTPNVGFHTVMKRHATRPGRGADLWVAALSPAGTFVWLQ
jgi:hypothetical protein